MATSEKLSSRAFAATERYVCLNFPSSYLKGKFEESLRYLEQATVGIRPHDIADVLSWRGEAHLALGHLDQGMSFR